MDDKRDVSDGRKLMFYGGSVLMVIGALTFLSNFVFMATESGTHSMGHSAPVGFIARALIGVALLSVGGMLKSAGKFGAAGSGIILDPKQARRDMEPWSRMGGGMMGDAVDESGVVDKLGQAMGHSHEIVQSKDDEQDFSDKLRKLHKLYEDGIIDQQEYEKAKAEILSEV